MLYDTLVNTVTWFSWQCSYYIRYSTPKVKVAYNIDGVTAIIWGRVEEDITTTVYS